MKRFLCFILIVYMLIPNTINVWAKNEDYIYTIKGDFAVINKYIGKGGEVVLPEKLGGVFVTKISGKAFSGNSRIDSIKFSNNITSIGEYAFSNCSNLSELALNEGLKEIGENSFEYCESISSLKIPDSVELLQKNAFQFCSDLENIFIGNSLKTLEEYTFANCTKLKNINIPNNILSVNAFAFDSCNELNSVSIGNGVKSFNGMGNCDNLTQIIVDENNLNFSSEDGILFDKNKNVIIQYPQAKKGNYSIPESVREISFGAFYACHELNSVSIPHSVKLIDNAAFMSCSKLTSILIPESVRSIGEDAFSDIPNLKSAYFIGNAPTIYESTFQDCDEKFKIHFISGKAGFTNPWNSYQTTNSPTIETVTDNSSTLTGNCFFGKTITVVIDDKTYTSNTDDFGKWTINITGKLAVGTKIKVFSKLNDMNSEENLTYVLPKSPLLTRIDSELKSISGMTYPNSLVIIFVNGYWEFITSSSEGEFTLKLNNPINISHFLYKFISAKVEYQGQTSDQNKQFVKSINEEFSELTHQNDKTSSDNIFPNFIIVIIVVVGIVLIIFLILRLKKFGFKKIN